EGARTPSARRAPTASANSRRPPATAANARGRLRRRRRTATSSSNDPASNRTSASTVSGISAGGTTPTTSMPAAAADSVARQAGQQGPAIHGHAARSPGVVDRLDQPGGRHPGLADVALAQRQGGADRVLAVVAVHRTTSLR